MYVFVPEHTGSAPTTGPVRVSGTPHELSTAGGVGTICASPTHDTVDPSSAGRINVGGAIV